MIINGISLYDDKYLEINMRIYLQQKLQDQQTQPELPC